MKIQTRLVLGVLGLLLIVLAYVLARTTATGKLGLVLVPAALEPKCCEITPTFSPALSPEERLQAEQRWQEDLKRRVGLLVDPPTTRIVDDVIMYEQPLLKQVFPDALTYVATKRISTSPLIYISFTMVHFNGRDYRMPDDFNRLMFDAGYTLNDKTQDKLAQALAIVAMPVEFTLQPVTCKGKKIHEVTPGLIQFVYVYEIHCHAAYENTDFTVKFVEFRNQQFQGGSPFWKDAAGKDRGNWFGVQEVAP